MSNEKAKKFLAHHGVMGMHWGQHLARGEGSATSSTRVTGAKKVVNLHEDHLKARELLAKKPSELSTSELKKLNDRQQSLKKYKELNPSTMSRGKKAVLGAVAVLGTGLTVYNQLNSPGGKKLMAVGKAGYEKAVLKVAEQIVAKA